MFNRHFISLFVGVYLLISNLSQPTAQAATVMDSLEASVNASIILKSDLEQFRSNHELRLQIDSLYAGTSLASKGRSAEDSDVVAFLIDEKLILQQYPIPDADVEHQINSIQSNLKLNRDGLKAMLADQGYRYEDYFEMMRASISKKALIERDIQTKVHIADDDVKNFFFNHYSKTAAGRTYRVGIITVTPSRYKSISAAKEIMDRALKDIKGGESFEEVAKRVSDDATGPTGGDLGLLTESQLSPNIRTQLKDLKIGQVSELFGTPQTAYAVVKLIDVKTGEEAELKRLTEEIRTQLAIGEYQRQIQLWVERQRQASFIHIAGQTVFDAKTKPTK